MVICVCQGITESQIEEAVDNGACTLSDLTCQLGVASQCGQCAESACCLLKSKCVESSDE